MSTTYYGLVQLRDLDLLDAQLEARLCGLRAPGPTAQACETFDNLYDGRPVRKFGRVEFDKTTRRWAARPLAGASPAELARLLDLGCGMVNKHGSKPGQGLRDKMWRHTVGSKDGHRYAYMLVVRYIDKSELLELSLSEALDSILTADSGVSDEVSHLTHLSHSGQVRDIPHLRNATHL